MSTLCTRCALRLRTATASPPPATSRAFSHTPRSGKQHGVPAFNSTTNAELSTLLTTIRNTHFIPAYLRKPDRRLIFGTKNRQLLADNPRSTLIGDEEVPLQWIDRRTEIPNRTKAFTRAVNLMAEAREWSNLAALLTGMKNVRSHKGTKKGIPTTSLGEEALARVVRKASEVGALGMVISCLQQAEHTGLSLRLDDVRSSVLCALHNLAQKDGWSEEGVAKSLRWAREIETLLEREEHGGGQFVMAHDARRRPEVIGVFLELSAVQAYKFQDGEDTDGKVKMYAERLLACIGDQAQPPSRAPVSKGQQTEMLNGVPIYHGLLLAEKVLGPALPKPDQARRIRQDYEAGLAILAQAIEAQAPKEGSYGAQALQVWRECIRD